MICKQISTIKHKYYSVFIILVMKLNLEFWMSKLPKPLTVIPITHLAIPGSHDSFSYTITPNSKVGPDATMLVKFLNFLLGRRLRNFVYKWSITQTSDIQNQLLLGIRYFDLRMATKPNDINFYTVHALYGDPIIIELINIKNFLDSHTNEIIILDFQHFYNFLEADHVRLTIILKSIFQNKVCPMPNVVEKLTLEVMRKNKWQVIIIYRHEVYDNQLWPSSFWPTPWPQTTSFKKLIKFLDYGLKTRKSNTGYVTQCLFTPDKKFILQHFNLSLQNSCAKPLNAFISSWIELQKVGCRDGVNIFKCQIKYYQLYLMIC
ncbi:PI-PLC X domain-containing protein 2 isoform X2 [Daktulosphaira vitifoliae]|uniref:PI-PLC X domain-containing protein 2 isoform X2 n=1 Tax=Daktulosphaira vitifoliae TaxID=58002 RepID=UPI0021AA3345|nr:PI-PLC X domain-containing protein 2 isoform X2 [Daktulosphaira vitifoliae]